MVIIKVNCDFYFYDRSPEMAVVDSEKKEMLEKKDKQKKKERGREKQRHNRSTSSGSGSSSYVEPLLQFV